MNYIIVFGLTKYQHYYVWHYTVTLQCIYTTVCGCFINQLNSWHGPGTAPDLCLIAWQAIAVILFWQLHGGGGGEFSLKRKKLFFTCYIIVATMHYNEWDLPFISTTYFPGTPALLLLAALAVSDA